MFTLKNHLRNCILSLRLIHLVEFNLLKYKYESVISTCIIICAFKVVWDISIL